MLSINKRDNEYALRLCPCAVCGETLENEWRNCYRKHYDCMSNDEQEMQDYQNAYDYGNEEEF